MEIQKFKLIAYATLKRVQGYRLLQNPAGTSPLSLRMIKSKTEALCDGSILTYAVRISRDFAIQEDATKEILYAQHNRTPEGKFLSYLNMKTCVSKSSGTEREHRDFLPKEYERTKAKLIDRYKRRLHRPCFFMVLKNNLTEKARQ